MYNAIQVVPGLGISQVSYHRIKKATIMALLTSLAG